MELNAAIPSGALDQKWERHRFELRLVSPANKDRAAHRKAFVVKCAAYLQQGVSLVVVDLVTSRRANLHREILDLAGRIPGGPNLTGELYAAAYRTLARDDHADLELWLEDLRIGAPLPTLPLWINEDTALPLELEPTYDETCRSLRLGA